MSRKSRRSQQKRGARRKRAQVASREEARGGRSFEPESIWRGIDRFFVSSESRIRQTQAIYERMLQAVSPAGSSSALAFPGPDLARLFGLYDEKFFQGLLDRLLRREPNQGIRFRFSSRMSRSGGKTSVLRTRLPQDRGLEQRRYEIAISAALLSLTFGEIDRPIQVCGLECHDRLEALQRIFEHEIVHLLELLVWNESSCSGRRFQELVRRLFGHTDVHHQLVTPRERALVKFGVKAGDRVAFEQGGTRRVGVVNRITRRATVLVESDQGAPYSDGKRYLKFYVPLPLLEKVD